MQVAQTIIQQLGGNRFAMMTGAKNFTAIDSGLSFKIGRNAKNITHVRVKLTPDDVYTMEFLTVRGTTIKTPATVCGVYCDMLQAIFTEKTGMYTSLGTMGRR